MAETVADLLRRIRARGANVVIDAGKLRIVNGAKLPPEAAGFIRKHAQAIAEYLTAEADFEERTAIIEYDGGLTRDRAEYLTTLLMRNPPAGVERADWSWFTGKVAEVFERRAA